jgi:hypothetical protein
MAIYRFVKEKKLLYLGSEPDCLIIIDKVSYAVAVDVYRGGRIGEVRSKYPR